MLQVSNKFNEGGRTNACAAMSRAGVFFYRYFLQREIKPGKYRIHCRSPPHSIHSYLKQRVEMEAGMAKVNLRDLYPDYYDIDTYVDVTDDVLEAIKAQDRAEAAMERKMYRYKAHYSLDCGDGIELDALNRPVTPEKIIMAQAMQEELYHALLQLSGKQAKRIYAHFYLGLSKAEIARREGIAENAVYDSINRGMDKLRNFLKKNL